jgi:hypothetical protein
MALHELGCEHRVVGEGYLVVPTAKHSLPGTNCVLHEEAGPSCLGGLKPLAPHYAYHHVYTSWILELRPWADRYLHMMYKLALNLRHQLTCMAP